MQAEELKITVYTFKGINDLPKKSQALVNAAKEATKNAWAPYSRFHVGAALELENGVIISGNNQENIAFPSGLCAERVALFYAGSRYPGMAVKSIAVAAYSDGKFISKPVFPCGSCRQVLLEHENRTNQNVEIIMYGEEEIKIVKSASDLLPLPFDYHLKL